jgi:hypothetical protein
VNFYVAPTQKLCLRLLQVTLRTVSVCVYGAGAGRYSAAASTSSCVYLMFITIAVNWFAADCNFYKGVRYDSLANVYCPCNEGAEDLPHPFLTVCHFVAACI